MTQELKIKLALDGATVVRSGIDGVAGSLPKLEDGLARLTPPAEVASRSLNNVGLSAKQTAAALRGVPAQFTDIFTSLAAGQAPMTVFLQQGGQLKDMFGGAGPAAKALGGYVMGMVNPLTLAAAAVGTLAYAYEAGSSEAQTMAKAIILTGNAAGTSVSHLQDMAASVAAATGATQGSLSAALAQIVQSGKVSESSLAGVAEAAIRMERATGQTIGETVKQFEALGKNPVEASAKLNEQYNYLTASVYLQIKALADQGKESEAVALAQSTFAEASSEMARKVDAQLGTLEKGWRGVAGAAKGAWDAMLNIGREDSLLTQLSAVNEKLEKGGIFNHQAKQKQAELVELVKLELLSNDAKATQNKLTQASIEWSKELDKSLSKQAQRKQAIAELDTKFALLSQGAQGDQKAQIDLAGQYEMRLKKINEQFADKKEGKSQMVKDAEALATVMDKLTGKDVGLEASYWKELDTLFAGYKRGAFDAKDAEKNTLAYATAVGTLTSNQKFNTDANKAAESAAKDQAKAEEEYAKALYAADDALVKKAEQLEYEVQYYGMAESAINAVIVSQLERARAMAAENGAYPEHLAFLDREIEARQRIASASGQKEILDANTKAAKEAARDWEKAGDDINRALSDALMRGFEAGKSYGKNFVDALENSLKTAGLKVGINVVTSTGGSLVNAAINAVAGTGGTNGGAGNNYLGLASNANSAYNLLNGNYLNTATGFYNNYLAGSTMGGYTLGYFGAGGSGVTGSVGAGALGASSGSGGLGVSATGGTTGITGTVGGYGSATAGSAGTAGAGGATPSSAGLGSSAIGWIAAIVTGMYMSGEAWQNGIRWENYAKDKDAKKYDAEVGIRALHDEPARAIFGDGFVDSKLYAVLGGGSLSAQIHGAVKKLMWGGDWEKSGKPQLRGTFSEDEVGFVGQEGQTYKKEKGWFSSGKKKTEWRTASEGVDDALDGMYRMVRNSLVMAGETFGDTSMADKLKGFSISTKHTNTSDMGATIGLMSEQLAQAMGSVLFPSIDALRVNTVEQANALKVDLEQAKRSGNLAIASSLDAQIKNLESLSSETWTGAFGRILQESQAVNRVFDLMGTSISEVFGTGNANRVLLLSDALVQMFGGIDKLNQSFSSYYANFYSQEEQRAQALEDMGKSFKALSLTMPQTRDGFRDLVEAQDLTTTSGQATFKALMDLQGGFAQLTPVVQTLADAQSNLRTAYDRQASEMQATVDRFGDYAKNLKSFRQSLLLGSLSPLDAVGRYDQAKAQYQDVSRRAQLGDTDAIESLQSVSEGFLEASRSMFASGDAYNADFASVIAATEGTESLAERQSRIAADSLSALTAQVSALVTLNNSVLGIGDAITQAVLATIQSAGAGSVTSSNIASMYQNILGRSADQGGLDYWTARAKDTSGSDLLNEFVGAATSAGNTDAAAATAWASKTGIGAPGMISKMYRDMLGRAPDVAGMGYWIDRLQSGTSPAEIAAGFAASDEYKNSHATGLERVPYDGYKATLHRDEAVVDAQSTRALTRYFGGGGGSGALIAEFKALTAEFKSLREEVKQLRSEQQGQHREAVLANYDANLKGADRVAGVQREIAFRDQSKPRFAA